MNSALTRIRTNTKVQVFPAGAFVQIRISKLSVSTNDKESRELIFKLSFLSEFIVIQFVLA